MMSIANLPKLLQPALKALEKDLLARAKTECVEAGLRKAWEDEQKAGQTGLGFDPWRRERVTQLAVAWILSVVFVRTLEDRGYIHPRVAGASGDALRAAEDSEWTLIIFGVGIPFLYPIWMPHKVASIGGWIYYHCSVSEEGSGNGEDGSMDICSMYQRGSV